MRCQGSPGTTRVRITRICVEDELLNPKRRPIREHIEYPNNPRRHHVREYARARLGLVQQFDKKRADCAFHLDLRRGRRAR